MTESHVSPNLKNTLSTTQVRFFRMVLPSVEPALPPKELDDDAPPPKTTFEVLAAGMKLVPLFGYVLFMPRDWGGKTVPIGAVPPFVLATDSTGTLLDSDDSRSGKPMPLTPGGTYFYLWSDAAHRLRRIQQQIVQATLKGEDPLDILEWYGVAAFSATLGDPSAEKESRYGSAREDEDAWSLLDGSDLGRAATLRLLRETVFAPWHDKALAREPSVGRAIPGSFLKGAVVKGSAGTNAVDIDPAASYVYARSRTVDALYAAELTLHHASSIYAKRLPDLLLLAQARAVVEIATMPAGKDGPVTFPPFEEDLADVSNSMIPFRQYAYDCARDPAVGRSLFRKAAGATTELGAYETEWGLGAAEVEGLGHKSPFPNLPRGGYVSEEERRFRHPHNFWIKDFPRKMRERTLHYFDLFRFGAAERGSHWFESIPSVQPRVAEELALIASSVEAMLGWRCPLDVVHAHADLHGSLDPAGKVAIIDRFLALATSVGHDYWTGFKLDEQAFWERLAPHVDSLGSALDKGGMTGGQLLENVVRTKALNRAMDQWLPGLVARVAQLEDRRAGKAARWPELVDKQVTVELFPDRVKKGEHVYRVKIDGAHVTNAQVLKQVREQVDQATHAKIVSVEAVTKPMTVEVSVRVYELDKLPAAASLLGDLYGLAATIAGLAEALKKDAPTTKLFVELTRDSLQAVESLHGALNAFTSPATFEALAKRVPQRLARWGKPLMKAGVVLEAVLNGYEAYDVLRLDENGDIAVALAEGRTFDAVLHTVEALAKGTTAVVPAGVAVVALASGESFAFAGAALMASLGFWLPLATIVVIAIAAYFALSGDDSVLEKYKDKVHAAARREFGTDRSRWKTREDVSAFGARAYLLLHDLGK